MSNANSVQPPIVKESGRESLPCPECVLSAHSLLESDETQAQDSQFLLTSTLSCICASYRKRLFLLQKENGRNLNSPGGPDLHTLHSVIRVPLLNLFYKLWIVCPVNVPL